MFRNQLMGSLTDKYTATQSTNGLIPAVGDWYYDENLKAKFIFLKNSGATAITASLATYAQTTDKSAFFTAIITASAALVTFAGVRVVGAASMAQGEFGWFQISGPAKITVGGSMLTADTTVSPEGVTAGTIISSPNTGVGAQTAFAACEAADLTTVVTKVNIFRNVWGL